MNKTVIGVEVEDVFVVISYPHPGGRGLVDSVAASERVTFDTYELAREAGLDAIALGACEFSITKITRVVPNQQSK